MRAEPFDELRTALVEARIDVPSASSGRRLRQAQGTKPGVHRLADPLALAIALALIGVSAYVGHGLKERGLPIVLPRPPLLAFWHPHLGWGTPLSLLCVLVGLRLQRFAAKLAWRRLLLSGWLLNLAWLCSLALIDGLREGWIDVLLDPNEYLHDVPRITDPAAFVATFTHFIAFGDGVNGTNVWTTHVAGHPPLATLIFWLLARIGLGGGFWAGALCILAASATSVAIPVTLRELGAGAAARRAVPFVALFPGAVWMAVSADGLFAGVATGGLALVCVGAARGRLLASLLGGLLLGTALFLSYGLVLFGLVVLTAVALSVQQRGLRPTVGPWLVACAGVAVVATVHLAYGFNWLTGLTQLRIRYYQGIASQRPFSYFVYANLAAWLISCSPLLAIAIARSIGVLACWRREPPSEDRVVALMAFSGVLAALVADLSALSKAETERIWLTFGVVAGSGFALLRGRFASWALVGAASWAILVNHVFNTGW
jgi:methylthioxylose transferase